MMPPIDMMQQCAPNVAPQTITAIIQVESGGNPFALNVNGQISNKPRPKSFTEAVYIARYYISKGYSVDLGLMQINSRNLSGLGYTIEEIFDPCTNLKAGSRILSRGYAGATKHFGPGQDALRAALSAYNTGNYERGFKNGYVAKYYRGNKVKIVITAPHPTYILAKAKSAKLLAQPGLSNPYTADLIIYDRIHQFPKRVITEE